MTNLECQDEVVPKKGRLVDLWAEEEKASDPQFVERIVTDATADYFTTDDCLCYAINPDWKIKPESGDTVRLYGKYGTVRGLFVNGIEVFYQTQQQQEKEESFLIRKHKK